MTLNILRRTKPAGTVTLPLAEYHATQIALDGAVARIDELERIDADRATILCRQVDVIAERTDERDRARRWAVHLEQEVADLEGVNADLLTKARSYAERLEWHHRGGLRGTLCQGCDQRSEPDEVEGVAV